MSNNREDLIKKAAEAILDAAGVIPSERYEEMWMLARRDAEAAVSVFEQAHTPTDAPTHTAPALEVEGDAPSRDTPTDDEREALIDVMVMTRLSDYAGTDMSTIHQAVDAILAAGFRRTVTPEPSAHDGHEFCDQRLRCIQVKPSDALTEKDLYELPTGSLVCRSWPNMVGAAVPDVYLKRGGWWLDLTDRMSDVQSSTGVIWSESERFTLIHRAAGGVR